MQHKTDPIPMDLSGPHDSTTHADQRQLRTFLEAPRYEIIPVKGAEEIAELIPREATVTITSSPSRGVEGTINLCTSLRWRDLRVVPHLAARLVSSHAHLTEIVRRLEAIGVTEVFVIGGDVPTPAGPYHSAADLLTEIRALDSSITRFGIAAYPESHPHVDDAALIEALERKQDLADYMITQMCFDAQIVVDWLHAARARGIRLPVRLGLAGPVNVQRLLRMTFKIGVRDSGRFLAKHRRQVGRLMGYYDPGALLTEIAPHLSCATCNFAGLHLFSFNQVKAAERWRLGLLGGEA